MQFKLWNLHQPESTIHMFPKYLHSKFPKLIYCDTLAGNYVRQSAMLYSCSKSGLKSVTFDFLLSLINAVYSFKPVFMKTTRFTLSEYDIIKKIAFFSSNHPFHMVGHNSYKSHTQ